MTTKTYGIFDGITESWMMFHDSRLFSRDQNKSYRFYSLAEGARMLEKEKKAFSENVACLVTFDDKKIPYETDLSLREIIL